MHTAACCFMHSSFGIQRTQRNSPCFVCTAVPNRHVAAPGCALAGDTALHLACSSPSPDLQLVSALVAAGATATQPRSSDGNTPLLLAANAGGQAGLALAKALLQTSSHSGAPQEQQQQQQTSSSMWCKLDGNIPLAANSSSSSAGGIDAADAAGETAVGVVAAAVLAACIGTEPAAAAAAAAAKSAAQQELLVLLLGHKASLSQQQAGALLQQGLAGKLSDSLTAKVRTWAVSHRVLKKHGFCGCAPQVEFVHGLQVHNLL